MQIGKCDKCNAELEMDSVMHKGRKIEWVKNPNHLSLYMGITGVSMDHITFALDMELCTKCATEAKELLLKWKGVV